MKTLFAKFGPFLGLLLVIGLFSLSNEVRGYFLSYANFKIVLTQTVIVALGALGMTLIIISGGIDLSVGSVIALTSVVGALLIQQGWPTVAVVLAVIAAGGVIGLLNGAAIAGLRMTPFIITLGTLGIARGVAKWLANNETVNYDASPINHWMTTANPFGWALPTGTWITAGLAVLTAIMLRRTVFGRHIFAIGSNEATARLCGVATVRTKILIYGLGGCFIGLAGLMQLSRLRQGDPTVAIGVELDIIAAVIIGGASLNGGVGTVLGSMIGALIMAVLRNGSQQMGWPTYFQEIIIGVVIIAAVFLDRMRQTRQS
ncbi:MAG: ABC transporter permease [Opitutaceae bacterium]|nr:ABC transporter permease [Opitutaceae bacterium]MBP9912515.1 ABC transporter permease [Opitutaceae bacterium]